MVVFATDAAACGGAHHQRCTTYLADDPLVTILKGVTDVPDQNACRAHAADPSRDYSGGKASSCSLHGRDVQKCDVPKIY